MGTKFQGTETEVRALDTYIKLSRAANVVVDRTNAHLVQYHLTASQFGVLEALYHLGTLAQVELSRKLLLSTANITTVLQNLEKRSLICRERDTHDQRVVRVSITEAGTQLVESILPSHVATIVEDLSVLSAEEQETLGALCRKLGLNAGK
ncbi:MAG: MarR family transcriptional regulator [Chloroflexi bacterium]|nr:MarR family transcriptional regulator [Chloroflexota bacterium]